MIRSCEFCKKEFDVCHRVVKRGWGRFCGRSCASKHKAMTISKKDMSGDKNPMWKGGISKNNYHYKKLQKQRYPERIRAREKLSYAVKSGKIQRGVCACGDPNTHAHHEDYSKPLEVIWLCRKHHMEIHRGKH